MSKYIIEIEEKPLCVFDKDTQTYFPRLWRVKGFNSLVFDEEGLSRLEELNSDYINEHFGDLQDTAYQRGLDDAWECGKKLAWTAKYGGYGERLNDVFGRDDTFDFYDYTPNEAIAKLKAYEQKRADKPIIGEVVERYLNGKRDGAGMFLGEDGDYWNCLFWTGATFGTFAYPSNQFKRTGNVCDITKILEAMKA